jgi:hypothetical protein
MRTVENYTNASVGSTLPYDVTIAVCPSCGRTGVLEYLANGAAAFVHAESEEVMGDGMLVEPIDYCPLPA